MTDGGPRRNPSPHIFISDSPISVSGGTGNLALSVKRLKVIVLSLLLAFIVLSATIIYFAYNVPGLKVYSTHVAHEPISIDGDDNLANLKDIVSGSGTEQDPYIIEWIGIATSSVPALQINNTDSYIVIRHLSLGSYYTDRYGIRVAEDSPTGIKLNNVCHVRIEDSMFRYLGAGISVGGLSNETPADIMVSRCVFTSCWTGVNASHQNGLDVESCSMQFISTSPISLADCRDCEVSLNRIEESGGVAISNCSGIRVHSNSVYRGAIHVVDSVDATVSNNSIRYGSWYAAIKIVRSSVVLVADNMMSDSQIYLNRSDRCVVHGNTLTGWSSGLAASFLSNSTVSVNAHKFARGVDLWNIDNCSVVGNVIRGDCDPFDGWDYGGITVRWGRNTVVSDNIVERTESGITVSGSNLTIRGNMVRDIDVFTDWGAAGIAAYSCSGLTVADNFIANISSYYDEGYRGLYLWGSSHVGLVRNNITNGAYVGRLTDSSIHDNSFIGPALLYFTTYYGFSNLTFFRNSFVGIDVRGLDGYELSWNEDYPIGGNYWSDYSGSDEYSGPEQDVVASDGDGIGDEPYIIDSLNVDYYPLMEPIAIEDLAPPITYASVSGLDGDAGWYRSDLNITLVSVDGCSGVHATHYKLNGGMWQVYTEVVKVTGNGGHLLEFYSVDGAGNTEKVTSLEFKIDSQPPIPVTGTETEYSFRDATQGIIVVNFTDDLSGVSDLWAWSYYYDKFVPPQLEVELDDSDFEVTVSARDMAGNMASMNISVESSINYDREPFSPTGPYGVFLIIALVLDFALLGVLFSFWDKLRAFGAGRPWKRSDKESWERDKVYDVEDGYSKFMKKQ